MKRIKQWLRSLFRSKKTRNRSAGAKQGWAKRKAAAAAKQEVAK